MFLVRSFIIILVLLTHTTTSIAMTRADGKIEEQKEDEEDEEDRESIEPLISSRLQDLFIQTKTQLLLSIFIATQVNFDLEIWYGDKEESSETPSSQFLYRLFVGLHKIDSVLANIIRYRGNMCVLEPVITKILYEMFATLSELYPLFTCDCQNTLCYHRNHITEDQRQQISILRTLYGGSCENPPTPPTHAEASELLLALNKKLLLLLLDTGVFLPYPQPSSYDYSISPTICSLRNPSKSMREYETFIFYKVWQNEERYCKWMSGMSFRINEPFFYQARQWFMSIKRKTHDHITRKGKRLVIESVAYAPAPFQTPYFIQHPRKDSRTIYVEDIYTMLVDMVRVSLRPCFLSIR